MHRTARAILGNDADADDATQEAQIGAWRRIDEVVDATVCAWISDEPWVHPSPESDIPIALYGILFADQEGMR